ncbi:hypothetical protein PVAND_009766 [Polypedilum vanderplanki]|uniref:Flavin-containing monooxygenase n=1 Tax=Polypedilum vanderplanki TaxID=319348 RepID=A0A9J6CDR4_POLVA|nr:hypothetical protein PVAND_009766 [Polypedilum vanderplanki]
MKRVCVVGAGAAGICAVKNCLEQGLDVIAFEQSKEIGGTWVYTDKTGKDENGLDIHSSMYRSLHTNLPKELMSFPDFPFPPQVKSYLPAQDVLDYLNLYADTFNVRTKIKFQHHVLRIRPLLIDDSWEMIVKNLITNINETLIFDYVLVCNGHFSVPHMPQFEGQKVFKGSQIHSHEYRIPNVFTDQRVLVIGAGSSGTDLSQEISSKAEKVFWSHHLKSHVNLKMTNIIQKPDISKFSEDGVLFSDGTFEKINAVVYCTGYEFTFPFLSVDSHVSCYENYVQPLYKHCININRPSLAFIGLIFLNCPFQTFDLQLRFILKFLTCKKPLPSRDEMLEDTEKDMNERWARGVQRRKAHSLGEGIQEKYYADLAVTADIEPIKPYVTKMYNETRRNKQNDLATFRNYKFTIIDDENFETTLLLS